MVTSLPTNIDSSYPDRSPGDKEHQQHHDELHGSVHNVIANAPDGTLFKKSGGLLVPMDVADGNTVATTQTVDNATIGPVTDADAPLSVHRGDLASIAANTWHTVLDLSGATELVGGSIYGVAPALRVTIDGTETIEWTGGALARDGAGNLFGVVALPACKAATSLKVEFRNSSSSSRDYGWRVWTR